MPLNDLFRASVHGLWRDVTGIVFDFGFVDSSSGAGAVDTNIAAGDFQTLVQATLAAALPPEYTFKSYRFACVAGVGVGQIGHVDVYPAVDGQLSENSALPPEIAIAMRRRTGYASRSDRGRLFFGPVHYQFVDSSDPDKVVEDSLLHDVRDLLKTNLVTQTRVLKPCLISAGNTNNGHNIIESGIGERTVHRTSRRTRVPS